MIKVLKQFCREYLSWLDAGAAKHKYFKRGEGLCLTIYDFALNHEDQKIRNRPHVLEEFLRDQFEAQGLNRHYPFGQRSYNMRCRYDSVYRCPKRVGWVRALAEDNDNETQHEQVRA